MKSTYFWPAGTCPSVNSRSPFRLASPIGLGSIVFICWLSAQPGESCEHRVVQRPRARVIVKRAS